MTLTLPCTLKGRKGRYQVVSKLTDGGMSTIYNGKSQRGQPVIVKEASGVDLAQSEERLRIEAEILRTLGRPGHPRAGRTSTEAPTWGRSAPARNTSEATRPAERSGDRR